MLKRVWPLILMSKAAAGMSPFTFEGRSIRMHDEAGAALELVPVLSVEGKAGLEPREADCRTEENMQSCEFPGLGQLRVEADGVRLRLSFRAQKDLVLQSLGLEGRLQMPGVRGWLSQGFQSWSQTGVIGVGKEPSAAQLETALQKTGEDEVYRRGTEFSWWLSFIGSDRLSFLAGANTAASLRSYVQFFKKESPDVYGVRLISGAGEKIPLHAGEGRGETWTLSLGPDLQEHANRYAAGLASRRQENPRPSQAGWNSWYDLWDDVTEAEFRANMPLVQEFWRQRLPAGQGPLTMTLDDGWEKKWGDWYPNTKFPSGIEGLARDVQAAQMQFGLWIAPLLVHPDSGVARQHPEWLVPNAVYRNPIGVAFRVLDVSQAAVAEHLQATIRRLVQAGVRVLKIDFLFAGALEGIRAQPWTGMQAYQEALRLIRTAAGPDVMLVAVGAPPVGTFPYVDAWRVGGDIAFKPLFLGLPRPAPSFIANQARSLAGRQAYCQVTLCDADPALLRALPRDEVEAGAWVAAAAGGAMVLSDHLPRLDRKRWDWGFDSRQIANGLSGRPARPASFFPPEIPADLNSMKDRFFTAEEKVPELWIMPDGTRVLMNFGNGPQSVEGIAVPKNGARVLP